MLKYHTSILTFLAAILHNVSSFSPQSNIRMTRPLRHAISAQSPGSGFFSIHPKAVLKHRSALNLEPHRQPNTLIANSAILTASPCSFLSRSNCNKITNCRAAENSKSPTPLFKVAEVRWMGVNIKYIALILLVAQNAMQMLSMRYSRVLISSGNAVPYLPSTAVVFSEILKLVACFIILSREHGRGLPNMLWKEVVVNWKETAKVSVPAFVYMLQNNLLYVATSNLDAATCQITYQLKILTTAMFAVTMLGQSISRQKWSALAMLVVGIVLVQLPQMTAGASAKVGGNAVVGLCAVLTACMMSGFAGIWFEKILKTSKTSIWIRNVQLSIIGGVLGLAGALAKDGAAIRAAGFMQGYSPLVWAVVGQVGLGGLLVAVVVKYADNVQKGFATSLSIIMSGVVSFFFIPSFAFSPSPLWLCGSTLVMIATWLYSLPPRAPAPITPTKQ